MPRWAVRARSVFRVLLGLYVVSWLVRLALGLVTAVTDTGPAGHGMPAWLRLAGFALLAGLGTSGAVWLAGAVVAGYRDPARS